MQRRQPQQRLTTWLLVYVEAVVGTTALALIALLLFWPHSAVISVWEVVLALSASVVAALVTGTIAIAISWRFTQRFGDESIEAMTAELRHAVSATIGSLDEAHLALDELVAAGAESPVAVLVLELGFPLSDLDDRTCRLLADRFTSDYPTLLLVRPPEWLSCADERPVPADASALWRALSNVWPSSTSRSPTERQSYLVPAAHQGVLRGALYTLPGKGKAGSVIRSLWSLRADQYASEHAIGVHSAIDQAFTRQVLDAVAQVASEPGTPYGKEFISAQDMLRGTLTGIPHTRALVTTQLLLGLHQAFHVGARPTGGTRPVMLRERAGQDVGFEYSPEQFLPPTTGSPHHSGSVLEELMAAGKLDFDGRTVWEVAAGPGFVTLHLSQNCGSGRVIATDRSPRAVEIARMNVETGGRAEVVEFVQADCLNWELESVEESGAVRLRMTSADHEFIVDDVLLDLPLLPYYGDRELDPIEATYLEPALRDESLDSCFPPTMEELLQRLGACARGTNIRVIVPFCTSSKEDTNRVRARLRKLLPNVKLELLRTGGFIRCYVARVEPVGGQAA